MQAQLKEAQETVQGLEDAAAARDQLRTDDSAALLALQDQLHAEQVGCPTHTEWHGPNPARLAPGCIPLTDTMTLTMTPAQTSRKL